MFRRHHDVPPQDLEEQVLLDSRMPQTPSPVRVKHPPHPSSFRMRSASPTLMPPDSSKGANDEDHGTDELEHVEIHRNETPHDIAVSRLLSKQPSKSVQRHDVIEANQEVDMTMGTKSNSYPGGTVPPSIFPSGPEDMFDPFTGAPIGDLRSVPPKPSEDATDDESSATKHQKRGSYGDSDAMWSQLATIRQLQSQVAKSHMAMDGQGLGSGIKKGEGRRPLEKDSAESSGPAVRQPSEDEFMSRKQSIQTIMGKVALILCPEIHPCS